MFVLMTWGHRVERVVTVGGRLLLPLPLRGACGCVTWGDGGINVFAICV